MNHQARYRIIETCVGPLALVERPGGELETAFTALMGPDRLRDARLDERLRPGLAARLERYFQGRPVSFDDVPIPAGPPFYRACWRACRAIPRGQTRSYGQLAAAAGSPRAVRAAGQAMRNNPLTVITPCHRVVSSDNALHGYAGSTEAGCAPLAVKERLLAMEGAPARATGRLRSGSGFERPMPPSRTSAASGGAFALPGPRNTGTRT